MSPEYKKLLTSVFHFDLRTDLHIRSQSRQIRFVTAKFFYPLIVVFEWPREDHMGSNLPTR